MSLESLVVLTHHSDLILDIRECYPQKGVDLFKRSAELMQYLEEILKHNILNLTVSLHHRLSVFRRHFHIEVLFFLFVLLVLLHLPQQQYIMNQLIPKTA